MSLRITLKVAGRVVELAPGKDLAGVERWRTTVWGSDRLRARGLSILPRLARSDLHLRGAELAAFADELAVLQAQLPADLVAPAEADVLAERLRNLVDAAQLALASGDAELIVW